ncbi:hypothetical protein QFC19_004601 [Naganishia cerealis]|uniref:Uncharacterized protein n=1 Tax=Naganishia cerealis TaxID=610337 RepID=A0ACC2VUS0_9TREE|nr:hypothetical protein QFC19_004601 [Naganishia cerealis]
MLALDLDIPVSYNIPVTILSAIVAILATFTTFGYELVVHYIHKLRRKAELKKMMQPRHSSESQRVFPPHPQLDSAAGLENMEAYDSVSPMSELPPDLSGLTKPFGTTTTSRRRWTGPNHSEENFVRYHLAPSKESDYPADNIHVTTTTTLRSSITSAQNLSPLGWNADQARLGSVVHFEDSPRIEESSALTMGNLPSYLHLLGIHAESGSTPSASDSSHPDPFAFERSSNGSMSSETMTTLFGPGAGKPWTSGDELSQSGSGGASILKLAKVVVTKFTWKVMVKGVLMGLAVVSMHYTGMLAMKMDGMIIWNWWLVALSILDACLVCMIAIIFTHTVTSSRDELMEAIRTKRALWRTMAEKEAAVRSDKMKMEFISVASHEIRTPLHVIAGYVDLLAQTELTQEQQEYIAALRSGCSSIRLITSDVLDFAKLQNPNAESRARSAEIDIRKIAMDVVQGCSSSTYIASVRSIPSKDGSSCDAPGDRPDIILEVDPEVPTAVFLDEVYVTRILMNLLNNALKFCSDGYILVRISMSDITNEGEPSMCISVRDTGIGIAKSFQSNIFAPFRQADTSLTRKHTGTGLGLAICRQLATSMHGNMAIWSQQGEDAGTELTVYLPLDLSTRSPSEGLSKERQPLHLDNPLSTRRLIRESPTHLSVGLLTRSRKKQDMLAETLRTYGFQVEDLLIHSISRSKPLDRAWIDFEALGMYPDKISQLFAMPSLQVFILCENAGVSANDSRILELTSSGAMVMLMPRPLNLTDASKWIRNPALAASFGGRGLTSGPGGSVGSQSTPLSTISVTSPSSTTPQDERTVAGLINGGAQPRVLLVDDNLVSIQKHTCATALLTALNMISDQSAAWGTASFEDEVCCGHRRER